jgi:hypothetical protein
MTTFPSSALTAACPQHMCAVFTFRQTTPGRDAPVIYHLDAQDRVIHVNTAWDQALKAADAPYLSRSNIVGRSLWDGIRDPAVQSIYHQLLARVRMGRDLRIPIRCDTPSHRRLFELQLLNAGDETVTCISAPIWVERRAAVTLLDTTQSRSSALVMICAWCKRIDLGSQNWVEIETAMTQGQLFATAPLPQLSHGICDDCAGCVDTLLG